MRFVRWHPLESLFWLALPCGAYFLFPGHLVLASQALIMGIGAVSLGLLSRHAGIVSLGHAAFFGAGAYAAGLLAAHGWREPLSGLLVAAIAAGLLGFVAGFPVLRLRGVMRPVATLGIGLLAYEAILNMDSLTEGANGLADFAPGRLFGMFDFDLSGRTAFFYSFAVVFLLFVLLRRFVLSSWRANPVIVSTLASAIAGIAGGLLAQTMRFVGPDSVSVTLSLELLLVALLGGLGRPYGALIVACVLTPVRSMFAGFNPVYWQVTLGLLLAAAVLPALLRRLRHNGVARAG